MTELPTDPALQSLAALYMRLKRVIALANGKGGVGKTSTTANMGGALAKAGFRVCLVDFDTQGNLALNLGYADTDIDDKGKGMLDAIEEDGPLPKPLEARSNLHVIPGGPQLKRLEPLAMMDPSVYQRFPVRFADLADEYDFVLIDCPPGNFVLQTLAMMASRHVLIPVTHDSADRAGLREIGQLVARVRQQGNKDLRYLGYFVFAHPVGATSMLAETRKNLEAVADRIPAFDQTIRYSKAAAKECRDRGLLIHELAAATPDEQARYAALRNRDKDPEAAALARMPSSSKAIAADYLGLAHEGLKLISTYEASLPEVEAVS